MSAMSGDQAGYYLGLAREDYYTKGGEPPGTWLGSAAAALDLSGMVEDDQLYNLFKGLSPDGTRELVQIQQHEGKQNHRPGWDLTFSAPKSVSVLWSQSAPEMRAKIQEAHLEAVRSALKYLEDSAGFTRRGQGGHVLEKARLLFACFEHSTSRALDPQLHTHALLMNIGVRPDGHTATLSSLSFFESKMAAGALYRAELACQLERLGIQVERRRSWFEVSGVPKDLVDFFSKRRAAIEAEIARRLRPSYCLRSHT
ncbi:MAG TPA: MobF family relaxase [Fimbriimonas sp.]|nr:MobF family relaxase [Fimbriimonas sp.]